jgi:thymidylate synthase (FAD)
MLYVNGWRNGRLGENTMVKYVEQHFEIVTQAGIETLQLLERIGRVCYKSEDLIVPDHEENGKVVEGSWAKFMKMIVARQHFSVLEHATVTVWIVTERGVTHEFVRHRIGVAYSQESTRYCNYGKGKFGGEITVIDKRADFYAKPFGVEVVFGLEQQAKTEKYIRVDDKHVITSMAGIHDEKDVEDAKAAVQDFMESMEFAEKKYLLQLARGDPGKSIPAQIARDCLPTNLKTEIVVTANLRQWGHIFKLRTAESAHPCIRGLMIPMLAEFKKRFPYIYDDLTGY